jgi:hypothetical protein
MTWGQIIVTGFAVIGAIVVLAWAAYVATILALFRLGGGGRP